jgi:D-amino-acid oxidase
MRVTVVGAGVIGLTTAIVLQRAGHSISVIAREPGLHATSGAAGAIWMPVRLAPGSPEFAWALASYRRLTDIARSEPAAGVDIVTACELLESPDRPWWAGHVGGLQHRDMSTAYPGAGPVWTFQTVRCEPALYLPWLESHLHHPIEHGTVTRLADLDGDIVVNCTGIGARALTGDASLVPVLGQTVEVAPGSLPLDTYLADERDPARIFYSIPRRRSVLLGGCRTELTSLDLPTPDPALRDRIHADARAAGYAPGPVLGERCGLRPVRAGGVRLQREGRVIHNYGHGGSGYALSWGCAEAVAVLVGTP